MKIFIKLIFAVLLFLPQAAAAICVQGDCLNGQGTVVLPDGRRYVGAFQDGIRTGRGLMTFPDGTKYLGDWLNDKPNGQGTLSAVGKFEYAGGFANGVREGQGTLETEDGKKYTGQWQNDVPHGQGKIIYPDGAIFVGQFENGRRNGQGEASYTDGTKYIGQWKDDLPNGQGTKIFVDGEKYTGDFRNGLMHGRGAVVKPDGSTFTGQWQGDVLVQKEEVVTREEISPAADTEGHVLAVVDEESDDVRVVSSSESMQADAAAAPTEIIANAGADFASISQNGVFVRSGPSTEYRIIRSVSRGFPVQIKEQQGDWSYVKDFIGQEGWIYAPLLGTNNTVIVTASKANLRSRPGLASTVLDQADFGTVLEVSSITGDWYRVTTPGGLEAWLSQEVIWPAWPALVPLQEISGAAATTPQEEMQTAQAVEPVIPVKREETGMVAQVDAPAMATKRSVDMPAVKVEPVAAAPAAKSGSMAVEPKEAPDYASVARNGKGANIRSEPSLASEVLRSIPPGYPMAVLERQGDWALVQDFRERQGWVYAALLTDLGTAVIKVGKGNLRSGPGLANEIVAKLDYGIVLVIDETREDWVKVRSQDGLSGWLHRDVLWP